MNRPKPRLRRSSGGTWYCKLYGIEMAAASPAAAYNALQAHLDTLALRHEVARINFSRSRHARATCAP